MSGASEPRSYSIVDSPSIYSKYDDIETEHSTWPQLIGLVEDDFDFTHDNYIPWPPCPCPEELHHLPVGCSRELIRIIQESLISDHHVLSPNIPSGSNSQQSVEERPIPLTPSASRTGASHAVIKSNRRSLSMSRWGLGSSVLATDTSLRGSLNLALKVPKVVRELKPRIQVRHTFGECAGCLDEILYKNMLTLDCQHNYCLKCFSTLIERAMADKAPFPPRCCLEEVPKDLILDNPSHARRKAYKLKREDYSVSKSARLYCPSPTCRQWIPPKETEKKCPNCRTQLCNMCRGFTQGCAGDRYSCVRQLQVKDSRLGEVERKNAIDDVMRNLRGELYRINKTQQYRICERHRIDAQSLHSKAISTLAEWDQRRERLRGALNANVRQRRDALGKYHTLENQIFVSRQEEDGTLTTMVKHLRDRDNRQERGEVLAEMLNTSQEQELAALDRSHRDARYDLESRVEQEKRVLETGMMINRSQIRSERSISIGELHRGVMSDRRWFTVAIEKRNLELEQHRQDLINGRKDLTIQAIVPEK